jgi:ubiquinone/menaquinone biosynthesis C-methylase UbiE
MFTKEVVMAALGATRRKPYAGIQMEGPLATWYAHTTGRDTRRHQQSARAIADRLPPGSRVLEVAPGPGYFAVALAQLGDFRITGLDISRSFVRIAAENARRAGVSIDFRHGDVARMPFPSDSFDFVVCQAAFKNFPDPVAALDEIHRVLRPGGRAAIQDLRKEAPREAIDAEVRAMGLSPLNAFLTRWTFRLGLLRAAYSREALQAVVARSRFGGGEIVEDGIGFELGLLKAAA